MGRAMLAQAVGAEARSRLAEWRNLVCGLMILILPTSLIAQDTSGAMLHHDGGVWVNGNSAPDSTAILPHDLVQTQKEHTATIDADGSTITLQPDTVVQFEGDELVLDHGGLQVNTSRGMRVRVNCITVIPVNQELTRYEVVDVDGRVRVSAQVNDVNIQHRSGDARRSKPAESENATLRQGEQATREERCGAAAKPADAIDAKGALLNNIWARGLGIAAVGVITCYALCRDNGNPISPSKP
jgi:hypothetical protein